MGATATMRAARRCDGKHMAPIAARNEIFARPGTGSRRLSDNNLTLGAHHMRVHLSSYVAAAAVALTLSAAPRAAHAQAKTSVCKDGTTSATTGRGACSGHGG